MDTDNQTCPICSFRTHPESNIDWPEGSIQRVISRSLEYNGCCSPECARTKATVDALDRLTVRPIRSVLSVEIGEALDDPHNAVFNKRSEPKRL